MNTDKINEFVESLNWSSPKNLTIHGVSILPTIVKESDGNILGLVYSSQRSLSQAMTKRVGIYYSRDRGLWTKSASGVNGQVLLNVQTDCDRDSLIFTVRQRGVFCHTGTRSCFSCFPVIDLTDKSDQITIGYTYGRSENEVINLLAAAGVHIFKSTKPRNSEFSVKSHLHDNI